MALSIILYTIYICANDDCIPTADHSVVVAGWHQQHKNGRVTWDVCEHFSLKKSCYDILNCRLSQV